MPLIETTGSASAKALGLNKVSGSATYIEDVFSTYLYTGNGANRSINNGIDISTKGGLVWRKARTSSSNTYWDSHRLNDTARGAANVLFSNTTDANDVDITNLTSFNSNGFSLGDTSTSNLSGQNYVSWTFRKQPKFFDVVTYTGNGNANRQITHNLGSVPGCIIVKATSTADNWYVYHRSMGNGKEMRLNQTNAQNNSGMWEYTTPTSTYFTVAANGNGNNNTGVTYVAYLFAHDAGGFGTAGTDNVISCGLFTTDASGVATVTLGYEPQWILAKPYTTTGGWLIYDSMRGFTVGGSANTWRELVANTTGAESSAGVPNGGPNATGFTTGGFQSSQNYIYIAIRRGPMKTPTSGTSVYANTAQAGSTQYNVTFNSAIVTPDTIISFKGYTGTGSYNAATWHDRLRGFGTATSGTTYQPAIFSDQTTAETTTASSGTPGYLVGVVQNTAYYPGGWSAYQGSFHGFVRAPGFMDVVCYTGTGSAMTVNHNLGVAPELMIVKKRSSATNSNWAVYHSALGNNGFILLNTASGSATSTTYWNNTSPTSSVFTVGTSAVINNSGDTYVAYLFASCPGVSKVGSYSGTGATQTISCGFAVRFVLIKRTDSTGDWWVWDTTRGMVAGTDPRLALNLTSAQINADWVYTDASGFQIVTTDASVNASGGTYIYLAIA